MKLKFYWIKSIYIILGCLLLQTHVILAKNRIGADSRNYLIDRDVKDFPKIIPETDESVFQLISHGSPGKLLLDGRWRNASQIAEYLIDNQLISNQTAHLNIYGCSFAEGPEGAKAIAYLQKKLHLSIAASTKGTQSANNYNFVDRNLYNGNNFYRLKMTEPGDKVSYTAIKNVRYDAKEPWAKLSPNPTSGILTFEFVTQEAGDVSITIDNIIGQRVLIKQVTKAVKGKNTIKLDVYGLANGVYLFNYQIGDQPNVKTIKFNKVVQ